MVETLIALISFCFRSIVNPAIEVTSAAHLYSYCDIMEMDIAICEFLAKAGLSSPDCINTIINTRDCLITVLSLLNPSIYCKPFSITINTESDLKVRL